MCSRFEEVRINLSDQPDWYLKKNPVGEVPLLEWIDASSKQTQAVPESLIICDYLDELHPEPRLHPTDPLQKAKQRVLVGRFGQVRIRYSAQPPAHPRVFLRRCSRRSTKSSVRPKAIPSMN